MLAAAPTGRKYNGDEPGLGKTRTNIRALELVGAKRPLIICPAIVRSHWLKEFDTMRWYEHGQRPVVKSYDEIVSGGYPLMKELVADYGIDALVPDECHYLKHSGSQRTQLIFGGNGYARRVAHVFPASGTPIPKNPYEFWPTLATLWPEVALAHGLQSASDFKARFCKTRSSFIRGKFREKILPVVQNGDEFRAILAEVMIARSLEDVGLDVPQIQWQLLRIDSEVVLTTTETVHYKILLESGTDLESIANDPHVARMRRRLGEIKAAPVAAMLDQQLYDSTEKIVVFAHHHEVMNRLEIGLAKHGVVRVDGNTSDTKRDAAKEQFVNDISKRVYLGQNIACQTGLDGLQHVAKRAVMVEPDWTATTNYQLGKRLARIGQQNDRVIVQMVALAGTLDEAIVGQNVQETRLVAELGLGKEIVMR